MPKAKANNIEIEYETYGDPSGKPLLLVMGLGAQMIRWDEGFIQEFVKRGFYVIIFDNRDVGLTTKFEEFGVPDRIKMYQSLAKGEKIEAPYLVDDMADDAIGLLDVLGIEKAHICGASMGGMIVQAIVCKYPSRVLSLTIIMSSSGKPRLPQVRPEALKILMTPAPQEREANIEHSVETWRVIWGSGFPFPEDMVRERARREYDRSYYPQGSTRQMVAVLACADRTKQLASVKVPTLVIHGKDDPLGPYEDSVAISKAIPGSELLLIEGMGHSLPPEIWPQVINAIVANTEKASS